MNESSEYDDMGLTRGPLHEQIADKMQEMLAAQRIRAGEKLPNERDLAKMLGVSRPTIREAMRLLQHRGLVTRKTGGGTYVIPMGADPVAESLDRYFWIKECSHEELRQVREMLEPDAAALAAVHATRADIQLLEAKLEALNLAFSSGDPKKHAKADSGFHIALAQASANQLLFAIITGIDHLVRKWNEITSAELLDETATKSHGAVLQAIKERDPARAREAMVQHLKLSQQVFERTALGKKR